MILANKFYSNEKPAIRGLIGTTISSISKFEAKFHITGDVAGRTIWPMALYPDNLE